MMYTITEKRRQINYDLEALKKEYHNLNDLLIPESEIRLLTELGKGIATIMRECLTAMILPEALHKVMVH